MIFWIFFNILGIFITAYYLLSCFSTRLRCISQSTVRKNLSTTSKLLDFGILSTLRLAWKIRATLWDDIPPYEKILNFLDEKNVKLARVYHMINWSSSGRALISTDLETVKRILKSKTWLKRLPQDHYLHIGTFGKPLGLLMGDNVNWKAARRAVMTAFREANLLNITHVEDLYSQEIEILMEKLRRDGRTKSDKGSLFFPNSLFAYPTIHVIFKTLFGRRLFEKDPVEMSLLSQVHHLCKSSVGFNLVDRFPFLKYFYYLCPEARAYIDFSGTIYDITILERDRRLQTPNKSSCPQDAMDSFLKTLSEDDGNENFTIENLLVTIRDVVLAGLGTTSVTLQHMILFLTIHQDKQHMAYNEIACFTAEHRRLPTYEDRNSMIYTQAMIMETLRLGSITPYGLRVSGEDSTLGDLLLKKGTYFLLMFIGVHRSKDLWEDPLVFRPERFISDDKKSIINNEKILPFSYGPRSCPGELSARIGIFMFAIALLREFKWEPSHEHSTPSMKGLSGLTRAPAPFHVKISPRNYAMK